MDLYALKLADDFRVLLNTFDSQTVFALYCSDMN